VFSNKKKDFTRNTDFVGRSEIFREKNSFWRKFCRALFDSRIMHLFEIRAKLLFLTPLQTFSKKENINKGRKYFSCGQSEKKKCEFFKWEKKSDILLTKVERKPIAASSITTCKT
jgi:hypothetical protein